MKTVSGILKFGKREEKAMRTVLEHCKRDIAYRGGGTFSKGDSEDTLDTKALEKALEGIEHFEWILKTYGSN